VGRRGALFSRQSRGSCLTRARRRRSTFDGGCYLPREEGVVSILGSQDEPNNREGIWGKKVKEQGVVDLFRGGSVREVREPRSDSSHSELLRGPYGAWRGVRREGFPMLGLRSID